MFGGTDDSKSIELAEKQLVEQQNLVARITSVEEQLIKLNNVLNKQFNPTKDIKKLTRQDSVIDETKPPKVVYCRFNWFMLSDVDLVQHTFKAKVFFQASWELNSEPEKGEDGKNLRIDWDQYEGWVRLCNLFSFYRLNHMPVFFKIHVYNLLHFSLLLLLSLIKLHIHITITLLNNLTSIHRIQKLFSKINMKN